MARPGRRKKEKAQSLNESLTDVLHTMQELAEEAQDVAEAVNTQLPAKSLISVEKILKEWRECDSPFLFTQEQELIDYHRAAMQRVVVLMSTGVLKTLEKLVEQLENPPEDWGTHDYIRLLEVFGSQLALMRANNQGKKAPEEPKHPQLPAHVQTEADLDAELAAEEALDAEFEDSSDEEGD